MFCFVIETAMDSCIILSLHDALPISIDDAGFVLWESNAIVRYLAAKHGEGTLYPADLRQRADADRWMDWQVTTLWTALRPLLDRKSTRLNSSHGYIA